jgi:hypothetical protein
VAQDSADGGDDAETVLRQVQEAGEAETNATSVLRSRVAAARAAGATWRQIGEHLGVTRQAAAKRFGEKAMPAQPWDQPSLF